MEDIRTSLLRGRYAATISGVSVSLIPNFVRSLCTVLAVFNIAHVDEHAISVLSEFLMESAGLYAAFCAYRSRAVAANNETRNQSNT